MSGLVTPPIQRFSGIILGGGGGPVPPFALLYWAESQLTIAGGAPANTSIWTPIPGALGNADAAITPLGTGANVAQAANGLATGGNARGVRATDFQKVRATNTQVASGQSAFLGAGENNTASGIRSVVGGGEENLAVGTTATIGGGRLNVASGTSSTVGGGNANYAQADFAGAFSGLNNQSNATASFVGGGDTNLLANTSTYSLIGGGQSNTVTDASHSHIGGGLANSLGSAGDTSDYSVLVGGDTNSVVGSYNFIGGGTGNVLGSAGAPLDYASILGGASNAVGVNGYYGSIIGGYSGLASHYAEAAHSAGVGINGNPNAFFQGGAQHSWVVWRNFAPAAVTTELFLDGDEGVIIGSPFRFNLLKNEVYQFEIQVAAKDTVNLGESAWWKIVGGVSVDGPTTAAIIGANTTTTQNTGGNSAGWTVAVIANAADDTLRIEVTTGASTDPIAFVASGHLTCCKI